MIASSQKTIKSRKSTDLPGIDELYHHMDWQEGQPMPLVH
jgi:hypothetical protein